MADKDFKVKTGLDLPAPLPVLEGGTGQTTLNNALNAMLPLQTGNSGKILSTDGTNTSWASGGSGVSTSGGSEIIVSSGSTIPLTITNAGTGNSFVVNDEASDTTPFIISNSGNIGVGGTPNTGAKVLFDLTGSATSAAATGVGAIQINQSGVTTLAGTAGLEFKASTASSGYGTKIVGYDDGSLVIGQRSNSATWTERMRIDATTGNVGIGTASPIAPMHLAGTSSPMMVFDYYASNASSSLFLGRKARGTIASPTAILSGDSITAVAGRGYGATAFATSSNGLIGMFAAENFTDTAQGSYITFETTPTGSTTRTERMRIDSAGQVGIGGVPSASVLRLGKAITGATSAYGVIQNGAIQSDVTANAFSFFSGVSTAAAAFTLVAQYGYYAAGTAVGAGSTITNQIGFQVASSHNTGTNNFGFSSAIAASGWNNYNFYAGGTAPNYFAGNVGIGTTNPSTKLDVVGTVNATAVTAGGVAVPTISSTDTLSNKTLTTPKITLTYSAKTSAYTFASGDEGNLFSMNAATAQQFNIPTDATFNFAVGTQFNVFWITGAGQPTIGAVTPGTTSVISTGASSAIPKLRAFNAGATIVKLAANSWIVFGDIA